MRRPVFSVASLTSAAARARCARPLNVPLAAIGVSVTTLGGVMRGIYPELLRALGKSEACVMNFTVVPRARQAAMFETGRADLLVAATRTPHRTAINTAFLYRWSAADRC